MSKLVSVVVPNYNCAEYLDKCLEHIVNQTYTNIECIVCDNASTDNSLDIINKWAAKDTRIKVLTTEVNQGGLRCYNRLFFEAKGDYIMIQDSDDWCDLQRVEKQVAVLDNHDVGCCMTNSVFYYSHIDPEYPARPGSGPADMRKEDWAPATIMFRRDILKEIPGYNLYWDRVTSYDNYFIMDIISRYGGYYLDEYLYFVWARPNSDHRSIDLDAPNALRKIIAYDVFQQLKKQRLETGTDWLKEGNMKALEEYEQKLMNDKRFLANKIRTFACIQIDNGKFSNGWALLKQAISTAPLSVSNYQSLWYLVRAKMKNNAE
ncbi:MAG: glycosyltransferase [Chitinophagaceae bacterium]|nr:glycosyltransferase [Chitinophagaceae bacterium]